MREITGINLAITSYCNLHCPDCCCNVPNLAEHKHVTWDYLVEAARYLGGLYKINITGGEPLAHPDINDWAHKLKSLFRCQVLYIETNATLAPLRLDALRHFDKIFVSHYTAQTYAEGTIPYVYDNTTSVQWLEQQLPGKLVIGEMRHTPRITRRGTKPCPLAFAPQVSYWHGLLYPCCVGPGLAGSPSVSLSANWKADIAALKPACSDCFYAEP